MQDLGSETHGGAYTLLACVRGAAHGGRWTRGRTSVLTTLYIDGPLDGTPRRQRPRMGQNGKEGQGVLGREVPALREGGQGLRARHRRRPPAHRAPAQAGRPG